MKLLKTLALSTALALAPLAAHAENFNFSYTFDPANTGNGSPLTVTGSFSGTVVGSLIENLSNLSVALNGTSFTGSLGAESLSGGAAVASSNIALDDFAIFDGTDPSAASNIFTFSGGEIFAVNLNQLDPSFNAISGDETASAAKWTLSTVPVPEPSSYALLLAGLALMTMVARRRSQR